MKGKLRKLAITLLMMLAVCSTFGLTVCAQSTNYASSKETLQIYYTGYIQFKPNYKIPANAGYYLTQGKQVKQAYVTYSRNGKCVTTTGARVYTSKAASKTSSSTFSATANAWDDLRWGDKYTTKFNYDWIYW